MFHYLHVFIIWSATSTCPAPNIRYPFRFDTSVSHCWTVICDTQVNNTIHKVQVHNSTCICGHTYSSFSLFCCIVGCIFQAIFCIWYFICEHVFFVQLGFTFFLCITLVLLCILIWWGSVIASVYLQEQWIYTCGFKGFYLFVWCFSSNKHIFVFFYRTFVVCIHSMWL